MAELAKFLPPSSIIVAATLCGYIWAEPDMHHGQNTRGIFFFNYSTESIFLIDIWFLWTVTTI